MVCVRIILVRIIVKFVEIVSDVKYVLVDIH